MQMRKINLLTGEYMTRRTDDQGNLKTTKGNRGRKELVRLTRLPKDDPMAAFAHQRDSVTSTFYFFGSIMRV
jgi:hypothetical protein